MDGKASACVSFVSLGNFLGVSFIILSSSSVERTPTSVVQWFCLKSKTNALSGWYRFVSMKSCYRSTNKSLALQWQGHLCNHQGVARLRVAATLLATGSTRSVPKQTSISDFDCLLSIRRLRILSITILMQLQAFVCTVALEILTLTLCMVRSHVQFIVSRPH